MNLLKTTAVLILLSQLLSAEIIKQNNVSVREGTGSFYPVITVLKAGTNVQILKDGEFWKNISVADNKSGYVPALAFEDTRSSIDYGVLADDVADRDISKTMVTAAVKGFFEYKLQSDKLNKNVMRKPLRRYFTVTDYHYFKENTYASTPWDHKKYMRKIKIKNPGSIKINDQLLATSAYIAARLSSEGLLKNKKQTAYVNMVAQLVAESTEFFDLPVSVHIADSDDIFVNATPAGAIVISRAMLGEIRSEHELACLLGHELSHVTLGHGLSEMTRRKPKIRAEDAFADLDDEFEEDEYSEVEEDLENIADEMFERSIKGRKEEYEAAADQRGALYAARAGYDPLGMINIMNRLESQMKRGTRIDDATHWFPYSFKNRKKDLQTFYNKNLKKRAPKFIQNTQRWNENMR